MSQSEVTLNGMYGGLFVLVKDSSISFDIVMGLIRFILKVYFRSIELLRVTNSIKISTIISVPWVLNP